MAAPRGCFWLICHRFVDFVGEVVVHPVIDFFYNFWCGELRLRLAYFGDDFVDEVHYLADGFVCKFHGVYEQLFRYFFGSGLDHRDAAAVSGDGEGRACCSEGLSRRG